MLAPRSERGTSPHVVAAMMSLLVLLVGAGIATYFIEIRGSGLQAELRGPQVGQILILGAALLLVAVTAYVAVVGAVGTARGASQYRALVRRALDTDWADAGALAQFGSAPELRELVGMLMAEKTQTLELTDRVEAARGELHGLAEGMQRSAETLGPVREESLSVVGVQVAGLWNGLVQRVQQAEAAARSAAAEPTVVGEALTAIDASENEDVPGLAALVERLDSLEAELQRLRRPRPGVETQPAVTPGAARPTVEPVVAPVPAPEPFATAPAAAASVRELDPETFGRNAVPWTAERFAALRDLGAQPVAPSVAGPPERLDSRLETSVQLAGAPFVLDDDRRAEAPAPAAAGFETEVPTASAADTRFVDMGFPHFVGRPVRPIPDRVAVTYEGATNDEVVELPAGALLFDSEPEAADEAAVVDLDALGAVEFRR